MSEVQVWDATNGGHSFTYTGHPANGVLTVAWSPDGSRIASAGDDGNCASLGRLYWPGCLHQSFWNLNGFQQSDPVNIVGVVTR